MPPTSQALLSNPLPLPAPALPPLSSCHGILFLTLLRIGSGTIYTAGSGVVVARRREGGWSAPCAVGNVGLGPALAVGVEVVDVVIMLRTAAALRAVTGKAQLGLGGAASVAVGLVGRHV